MAVMKNGIKKINRKISNKVRNHQHCSLRTVVARDKKERLFAKKNNTTQFTNTEYLHIKLLNYSGLEAK